MNRTIKTKFSHINLIAALFLCSIFSFNAIAQDNPLNSQQLANLIKGLKGALQENLAVIENTNGKQYTAITQKWDARQDLAGKSKRQVIDLLFQDGGNFCGLDIHGCLKRLSSRVRDARVLT